MLHLASVIDRATGYVFVPPSSDLPPGAIRPADGSRATQPNEYTLLSTAAGPLTGARSDVRDVQERWIDAREDWDAFERREWRREGEITREQKAKMEATQENKTKIRERAPVR